MFCFFKEEINLKIFWDMFLIFKIFLENILEKTGCFNIRFVSYSVNI
jgi:hypothetical protein